jgi:hypothetical protein
VNYSPLGIHLVVAKYKENIDWAINANIPYTIYNKDQQCNDSRFINLPNIGREAHTYLHYIVSNYHNLPNYVFFSEGNCMSNRPLENTESIENLYSEINNFRGIPRVKPMGTRVVERIEGDSKCYELNLNVVRMYEKLFKIEKTEFVYYIGGQLIVPRSRITFHSHTFYKHIYENISDIRGVGYCAWTLERLWPYIYDGKTKSVIDDC